MRVTKRQLRRIIKEEKQRLLKEQGSWGVEVLNPLIEFGQAWSGLGGAVQDQMVTVVNGYIENNEEEVWDINPNALDVAMDRLRGPLANMDRGSFPEAGEVLEALKWAEDIFAKGDAEVEADARAAGDR